MPLPVEVAGEGVPLKVSHVPPPVAAPDPPFPPGGATNFPEPVSLMNVLSGALASA